MKVHTSHDISWIDCPIKPTKFQIATFLSALVVQVIRRKELRGVCCAGYQHQQGNK